MVPPYQDFFKLRKWRFLVLCFSCWKVDSPFILSYIRWIPKWAFGNYPGLLLAVFAFSSSQEDSAEDMNDLTSLEVI